jgi:Tn3 transposase DDE domain
MGSVIYPTAKIRTLQNKPLKIRIDGSRILHSEVAAMIEGLIRHDTEMRVEKNFVDSHGQSEVAFAFCLMPRLKRLKYERPYLPDKGLAGACPNLAGVTTNANAGLRWLSRNPPDLAEARACLQRIIRDGNRASEVIARVHALAKRSTPPKGHLDLRDTIHEVLALIEREARRHGVAVHTDLAADLPLVRADRVQLQQVLLNLVLNGLDAMQAVTDRPCVSRIRAQPHAAGHMLVAVQDAGIGLDPQGDQPLDHRTARGTAVGHPERRARRHCAMHLARR